MNAYTYAWAKAFGLTLFVELIAAFLLIRWVLWRSPFLGADTEESLSSSSNWTRIDMARMLALIGFANVASHPAVWFIIPSLHISYPTMVLIAESWAVLSETAFYALTIPRIGMARAFGVALVANGLSFGLGLLVRALTGLV